MSKLSLFFFNHDLKDINNLPVIADMIQKARPRKKPKKTRN